MGSASEGLGIAHESLSITESNSVQELQDVLDDLLRLLTCRGKDDGVRRSKRRRKLGGEGGGEEVYREE